MPVLKAHQFAVPSKSDYYTLQKMMDAAMAYVAAPNQQDRRAVYCDARGETWHVRDRDNSNKQTAPLEFKIDGDDWLTVCFDFTGSRIWGVNNTSQDLLHIENTGSGNMRDVRLTGGNWVGGRTGIKVRGLDYCQIDNVEVTQSWLVALDIKGGGARSVRLQNIGIQEPRCFSAILERGVEFHNLRASESVGGFICSNGTVSMWDSHLSGFNMMDGVKRWPNLAWGGATMWEAAGHTQPQNLEAGVPMRPIFTLLAACSLNFTGFIKTSYVAGQEPPSDNPARANVVFNLRRAGDLNVDAEVHCDENVKALVAEEYLYANKDTYWTDVRLRGLTMRADMHLHRRTLPWGLSTVAYPTVRSRTNFSGHVRAHNASNVLQDQYAPVDLANLNIITA